MARNKSETPGASQAALECPRCRQNRTDGFDLVQMVPVSRPLWATSDGRVLIRAYLGPRIKYELAEQVNIQCAHCGCLFDVPAGIEIGYQ